MKRIHVRRTWNDSFFRQRGATAAEYAAVMVGLIAVWEGARVFLDLIHEHHSEFSWALMIPF